MGTGGEEDDSGGRIGIRVWVEAEEGRGGRERRNNSRRRRRWKGGEGRVEEERGVRAH